MKRRKTVLHLVLIGSLIGIASADTGDSDSNGLVLPSGEYIVTAIRRANMVESTADAEPNIANLIGEKAQFDEILYWIDGLSCQGWTGMASRNATLNLHDPLLSDLAIEELEPPAHDVIDFSQTMDLYCDRSNLVPVANLTTIDDRVLVTASPAGTYHLILEKPLSQEEIRRLQVKLKDIKFYDGDASGEMDEATRAAVSAYAESRGAEYRFKDVVITRNLLDGLGVLIE